MRLAVLDHGHPLKTKVLFALIHLISLRYRPDFFGARMSDVFQEVMRGPSSWSVADRELMAAFVSKTNACEF